MLETLGYVAAFVISTFMMCLNVSQMEAEAKLDHVHNFIGVIWATLLYTFGRILIYQGFVPLFLKHRPGETVKANKCAQQFMNFFFHGVSSVYLMYSLPRRAWFASDDALWNLHPEVQDWRDITFYILQMGYHANCLAIHFSEPRREDHHMMLVHHSSTVILIVISFMGNYIRGGMCVLLYHDTSDILGCLIKMTNYMGWKKTTLAIYPNFVIVWIMTRLYYFPRFIMITWGSNLSEHADTAQIVAYPLMWTLVILHAYWFYLFMKMGWVSLMTKGKDIQDLSEAKLDKERMRLAKGMKPKENATI